MNVIYIFKSKFFIYFLFLFLFVGSFISEAQENKKLSFPVTQYKLKNGLQVILSEDYSLPLVSVVVAYNVGSINEKPEKTGLAYLLGNLMFQGSENVSRMQHISLIHKIGGELNASTTEDKTIFQQTVPSHQLARVLWLESDRMNSLDINAINVEQAKEALIDEIHNRIATEPYLGSYLAFDKILYPDFAFNHPVTGNETDLRNLTVEDVKNFYDTFYTPNNAILSIAGHIDKRKAMRDIRKYFENIPAGKDIPPLSPPKPQEKKPIVKTHEDSLAPSPGFLLGYNLASPASNDFYPLTLVEYILLRGKTSRLYKRLIKRVQIALSISGGIEKRKDLATIKIFIVNNNRIMAERSKRAVFSEISKLKSNLVPRKELRKSKNMFQLDYLNQFTSSVNKARFFAETYLSKNKLDDPSAELDKYLAITSYDISRVMKRYFTRERILDVRIR